jgi:hypothetical protein
MDLGGSRRLIWIIDSRKIGEVRGAGFGVIPLYVAPFAHLKRRVSEGEEKIIGPDHLANFLPCALIGTYGGANDAAMVSDNFRGDETDSPDIGIAVFSAEPQAF